MKIFVSLSLVLFFLVVSAPAYPDWGDGYESTKTLGCGGAHIVSSGELGETLYRFRNFNSDRTLTITEITIFAVDGTVLATFSSGTFPVGFNDVLGPNQTTGFSTSSVFGNTPPGVGLLQTTVKWEGDRGGNALYGTTVRVDRARDPGTGAIGATRSRDITDCLVLK